MLTISVFMFGTGFLTGWFWAKHYFTKGEGKPLSKNKDWDILHLDSKGRSALGRTGTIKHFGE